LIIINRVRRRVIAVSVIAIGSRRCGNSRILIGSEVRMKIDIAAHNLAVGFARRYDLLVSFYDYRPTNRILD